LVEHLHGKEGVDGSSPSEGLQKRRTSALLRSGRLARHRACGGYGAVYGAFALARPYSLTGERGSDLIEFEAECGCAGDSDGEAKREDAGADEREVTLKRLLLIYSEAWDCADDEKVDGVRARVCVNRLPFL
jgi:hypothetical protein